jgi:hypothetical protein
MAGRFPLDNDEAALGSVVTLKETESLVPKGNNPSPVTWVVSFPSAALLSFIVLLWAFLVLILRTLPQALVSFVANTTLAHIL